MGGDQQGSPYGGAATTQLPFQLQNSAFDRALNRATLDRRSSDQVSPYEDIMMKFRARIINDILKGKINLDDLQRGEQMNPQDNSLPNEQYFRPMA